jgi:hypothetical protein
VLHGHCGYVKERKTKGTLKINNKKQGRVMEEYNGIKLI